MKNLSWIVFLGILSLACIQADSVVFVPNNTFTSGIEGPAVGKDGSLYAVNYATQGTIGVVKHDGSSSLFVTLPEGSTGNGICINKDGHLFVADYTGHNILRVFPDKKIEVFAHDDRMNQPNDLTLLKGGDMYASDPKWSDNTGKLWYISNTGKVKLLEENMGTTNGVEVSPDEKYLYVNESVSRVIWRYSIGAPGVLSNKIKFYSFDEGGMDGMRCDIEGNLYVTRYGMGEVAILSPEAKLVKTVRLIGEKPTNVAFGGPEGKTCYVTIQETGSIETFTAMGVGRLWKMIR